jgi:hypothetical protein
LRKRFFGWCVEFQKWFGIAFFVQAENKYGQPLIKNAGNERD